MRSAKIAMRSKRKIGFEREINHTNMEKLSRADALEEISTWSNDDVLTLLRTNGLEETCCTAILKRQIDGDELLHLTEGKLALWKNDLMRPQIWLLWNMVEEIRKCPENFVEQKQRLQEQRQQQLQKTVIHEEVILSDSGSWDTDFEDEDTNSTKTGSTAMANNSEFQYEGSSKNSGTRDSTAKSKSSLDGIKFRNRTSNLTGTIHLQSGATKNNPESSSIQLVLSSTTTYANCSDQDRDLASSSENEAIYANVGYFREQSHAHSCNSSITSTLGENLSFKWFNNVTSKNIINNNNNTNKKKLRNTSKLHGDVTCSEKSLAEMLKEELQLRGVLHSESKSDGGRENYSIARPSFLHAPLKNSKSASCLPVTNDDTNERSISPPIASQVDENISSISQTHLDEHCPQNKLPKPLGRIRNLDFLSNLPPEASNEGEHENLNSSIPTPQENRCSSESVSNYKRSVACLYNSGEEDDEVYEIYESITESPEESDDNFHRTLPQGGKYSKPLQPPPPLPMKPPNVAALQNIHQNHDQYNQQQHQDHSIQLIDKLDEKISEKSPEKEGGDQICTSATTPLLNERSIRPLPPTPEKILPYHDRTWFQNLTREQANTLVEEHRAGGNISDGLFFMRPSFANPNNPLTLVLWCKDRIYNVPVRRRPDNRYALGSSKVDEQSFASIDDIVSFYKEQNLLLYTGGVQTASITLTDTPQKNNI